MSTSRTRLERFDDLSEAVLFSVNSLIEHNCHLEAGIAVNRLLKITQHKRLGNLAWRNWMQVQLKYLRARLFAAQAEPDKAALACSEALELARRTKDSASVHYLRAAAIEWLTAGGHISDAQYLLADGIADPTISDRMFSDLVRMSSKLGVKDTFSLEKHIRRVKSCCRKKSEVARKVAEAIMSALVSPKEQHD